MSGSPQSSSSTGDIHLEIHARSDSSSPEPLTPPPPHFHTTVLKRVSPLSVAMNDLRFQMWLLEGNICASKTTLGTNMTKVCTENGFEFAFYKEEMDPVLIGNYYKKPAEFGFAVQIFALERCNSVQIRCSASAKKGALAVGDRGSWGNDVFRKTNKHLGFISEGQSESYDSIRMSHQPVNITGVLYLDVAPARAFERHRMRLAADPKKTESGLTPEYLAEVDRFYCAEAVNRLYDGSSNVLIIEDSDEWVKPEMCLRRMAQFSRHYKLYEVAPGRNWLAANWSRYSAILTASEPDRRKLMKELSDKQLDELRKARLEESRDW